MNKELEKEQEMIKSCEKWFKFSTILPIVAMIIYCVIVLAVGIVVTLARLEGGLTATVWVVGLLSCPVICPIIYSALKLALSYQILHIYYLKDILCKINEKK